MNSESPVKKITDPNIKLYGQESDFNIGFYVVPGFAVLLAVMGILVLSTIWIRANVENRIHKMLVGRTDTQVTYEKMKASVIWNSFEMRNVECKNKLSDRTFKMRRLVISEMGRKFIYRTSRNGLSVPDHFKIGVVDFQTPVSVFSPETARFLQDLGYKNLAVSFSSEVTMDREKNTLQFSKTVVDFNDGGRFVFSMDVAGFDLQDDKSAIDGIFNLISSIDSPLWKNAAIRSLDLRYHDRTMADRLNERAQRRGESGPFAWAGITQRNIAEAGADFRSQVAAKLRAMSAGSPFTVRLEPTAPIPVKEFGWDKFGDLNSAQKKFGLRID